MKSFGTYISKHLVSFATFIFILLFINVLVFGFTFHQIFSEDYGESSPPAMLEMAAAAATPTGIPEETKQTLHENHIWALYLNQSGTSFWSFELPEEIPESYTIQDVALFSKGYIADYPVFVWSTNDGLLVLGYPKDSYTKLTSNYYSLRAIQTLPAYVIGMLIFDLLFLFFAYYISKRKIIRNTEPIVAAIGTLADGNPVTLAVSGELSEVADSVNRASRLLSRQNQARANWISGVSHDIRTPLSMIMGYAEQIAVDNSADNSVQAQAEIIRSQSIKIKELVADLNLVSQLEYEMQPLHKETVRFSKLLRSYVADLLNTGISDIYQLHLEIDDNAETMCFPCDTRLISRAINNLVQNSIKHNPNGCDITLRLEHRAETLVFIVGDNGIGLSPEKLQDLDNKPHYMESTDERLDLRHGLGLLIVQQIVRAHNGTMRIENAPTQGVRISLCFQVMP